MQYRTRNEAKKAGQKFYYPDKNCKHNHPPKKYVCNYRCWYCVKKEQTKKNKHSKEEVTSRTISRKEAKKAGLRIYYNKTPCPKGHTGGRYTCSSSCVECCKLRNSKNSGLERLQKWKKDKLNKGKINANTAKRRAIKSLALPKWADDSRIVAVYELCSKLNSCHNKPYWHVDHIIPLQGNEVCGLHVETNLQIIPASENYKKRNALTQP